MPTPIEPITTEERPLVEAAYEVALEKLKTTTHPIKRQFLLEELTEWCEVLGYPLPGQLLH